MDTGTYPPSSTKLINSLTHDVCTRAAATSIDTEPTTVEQPAFVFTGKMASPPPDEATEAALRFCEWFHCQASTADPLAKLQGDKNYWDEHWLHPARRLLRRKSREWMQEAVTVVFTHPKADWLGDSIANPLSFESRLKAIVGAVDAARKAKAKPPDAAAPARSSSNNDWASAWSQVADRLGRGGGLAAVLGDQAIPRHARIVAYRTGSGGLSSHRAEWAYRDAWNATGDPTAIVLPPHIAALIDGEPQTTTEGLTA